MSEMLVRVARALCKASAERSAIHNPGGFEAEFARLWEGFGEQAYKPQARAAIAAMREPSVGAINAGAYSGNWSEMTDGYPDAERACAAEVWKAMIDKALED